MESKESRRVLTIRLDILSYNFKQLTVFRKQVMLIEKTNIDVKMRGHSMMLIVSILLVIRERENECLDNLKQILKERSNS